MLKFNCWHTFGTLDIKNMATIRKKGPFQFHVQIRRKGYPQQSKTFDTYNEAESWAIITESEMKRGKFVSYGEAERMTLYDALKKYRDEITPTKKGSAQETTRINKWLGVRTDAFQKMLDRSKKKSRDVPLKPDPITGYALASLTTADFSKWRDLRLKDVAPATVTRDLSLFSHVFTACVKDWGIAVENPLKDMRKPAVNNERDRRFEMDEEKRLFAALEDRRGSDRHNVWMKPLVEIAIETAMRQSEILGMTWKNVKPHHIHIPDSKNNKARDVPLSKRARAILDALPERGVGKVFKTTFDALQNAFPRFCERAKIDDLTFHDLRHEATSRLAKKLEMHELMKMTGHKNAKMLLRYYHPRPEDTAKKLD
jgi:integrase